VQKLDARIDRILADRQSGSRAITRGLLDVLRSDDLPDPLELEGFLRIARRIQNLTPSFALLFDLLHAVGRGAYPNLAAPATAAAIRTAADRWGKRWEEAQTATTQHAAKLIEKDMSVAAFSQSGAILSTLSRAADAGKSVAVACSEAIPGGEGTALLSAVNELGHRVIPLADTALPGYIERCDLVLLGADAVFDNVFWNKLGSLSLALAARFWERPLYIIAETMKWVPETWGLSVDMSAAEPRFVPPLAEGEHHRPLFEAIPTGLATRIISERGVESPNAVVSVIADKSAFEPLVSKP